MSFPGCQISKCFSAAFTQQVTRLSGEASAHVVVLAVDGEIAPGPDGPRKGSLMNPHEPAVRINGLGNSRQGWKCWVSHTRWLIAAGARLIRTLLVVVYEERLGELSNLRERGWPMNLQTLLTQRTMKALDVGIQIGSMRGDDIGLHAQAEQEAYERGREIPSRRTADLAGVIVKGEYPVRAWGQAMLAHKLGHHLARALRRRNRHVPLGATRSRCQHRRALASSTTCCRLPSAEACT
jgi:hypothetical protein